MSGPSPPLRTSHRPALPALDRQPLPVVHLADFDGRRRDRRGRADRRAVGHERFRAGTAVAHPEPDVARDNHGVRRRPADWQAHEAQARRNPRVVAVAPFVETEALLIADRAGGSSSAATLRGIDPALEAKVSALHETTRQSVRCRPQPVRSTSCSAAELAQKLGVSVGDQVVVAIAQGSVTPAGVLPRMRRFKVGGNLRSGMYEIDATLAVTHLDDAGRLLRLGRNVTGLRLAVRDPYEAPLAAREVATRSGRRTVRRRLDAA